MPRRRVAQDAWQLSPRQVPNTPACLGTGWLAGVRPGGRAAAGAATIVQHCVETQEYVPVFVDGTGIEVQGHYCEGTARGYNGEKPYWLHPVFVGAAGSAPG